MSSYSLFIPGALPAYPASRQFVDDRFKNPVPRPRLTVWQQASLYWDFFFDKTQATVPDSAIPVVRLTRQDLIKAPDNCVYRLGHSSLLIKMHDRFWLTDPSYNFV